MAKCQHCNKRSVAGKNVSHSAIKTLRLFRANIQKISFFDKTGKRVTASLCTKCIKKMKQRKEINLKGKDDHSLSKKQPKLKKKV